MAAIVTVSSGSLLGQRELDGGDRVREGVTRAPGGGVERPVTVGDAAREGRGRDEGLPREWDAMATELGLSPEQKGQLLEKARALHTALADFDAQNQERIRQMREAAQDAERSADREVLRRVWDPMRKLQMERGQIEADFQKQMMELLTPAQKDAYAGLKILQDREFQAILKDAGLSPEQESQLKDKARTLGVALAKWESENGEKLRSLEKQIDEAQVVLRPLREARDALVSGQRTEMLAILTPEQKQSIAVARLQETMVGRIGRGQLSEDQIAKIKTICTQAVSDAGPADLMDPQTGEALRTRIAKDVREQVLTEAQRTQLDSGSRR